MTTTVHFIGAACCALQILRLAKRAHADATTFYAATPDTAECVEFFLPGRAAPLRANIGDWLVLNGNSLVVYDAAEYAQQARENAA